MNRIEQRRSDDCVACVVAMITDSSYEDVVDRYQTPMSLPDVVDYAVELGYEWISIEGDSFLNPNILRSLVGMNGGPTSALILVESPISERDEEAFWEYTAERGDMVPKHAVGFDGDGLVDPKGDPYWESLHDLTSSPYEVTHYIILGDKYD